MARPPASDDDAALRWDEFDDPSYSDPSLAGLDTASKTDDASGTETAPGGADALTGAATAPSPSTTVARLLTGAFAVVYLAYAVGWIIGVGLVPLSGPTLVIEVMYQFSEFLAIAASALWFATVLALTRGGRTAHRLGWLALGTLVLVPWPLVLGILP